MLVGDRLIEEKLVPVVVDQFWMIEAKQANGDWYKIGERNDNHESAVWYLDHCAKPRNKRIKNWRIIQVTTTEMVVDKTKQT